MHPSLIANIRFGRLTMQDGQRKISLPVKQHEKAFLDTASTLILPLVNALSVLKEWSKFTLDWPFLNYLKK